MQFYIVVNEYGERITSLLLGVHGQTESEIEEYFHKEYPNKNYKLFPISEDIQEKISNTNNKYIYDEVKRKLKELPKIPKGFINPKWQGEWVDIATYEDIEKKKSDLLAQAKSLKNSMAEQGFIFRENLRQPCREQDKTSVTAKVLELQFTKQPSCEWKFFDKDTGEHIYKTITLEELVQIGIKIGQVILNSMKAESRVIEELKHISEEDLKTYDIGGKFN